MHVRAIERSRVASGADSRHTRPHGTQAEAFSLGISHPIEAKLGPVNSGERTPIDLQGRGLRRRLLGLCLAALLIFPGPLTSAALDFDPVARRAEVIAQDVYDVAEWALRVPYQLAYPIVARAKLEAYLDDLPLEKDVRRRVRARIEARDFVDEVVPFLIALKDTYSPDVGGDDRGFDAYLRDRFDPADGIAGFEHSMFRWNATAEPTEGVGFTPDLAGALVALYDAMYLGEPPPSSASTRETALACDRPDDRDLLLRRVDRTGGAVRNILTMLRDRFEPENEIGPAIDALLIDDARLRTVTVTLVQFVDSLVCKHYRVFAGRVVRERQLGAWMKAELAKPGGGELWRFLDHAQNGRRYAMLAVVDGLQGGLIEALAAGRPSPFLERVVAEHERGISGAGRPATSTPAPEQSTEFIQAMAGRGFLHDAYLPFFHDLYNGSGPHDPLRPWGLAEVGVATTPTISVRNLPVAKTGAPVAGPGSTGIPNFHFVDRTTDARGAPRGRAYYFFGNDALLLPQLTDASGMRSLYDRLPTLASFNCAAQYDERAHYTVDALINLALGEKLRDFAEIACTAELSRRAANERTLRKLRDRLGEKREAIESRPRWYQWLRMGERRDETVLAERLIERIAELEQDTIPELLLYYNPWPDHFAHFEGPFSDAIVSPSGELARLDYWLGRFDAIYREAGVYDRTLFAMAGDHGLTPVYHLVQPEDDVFARLRESGVDFGLAKISSDEGEGPKLTDPLDPPAMTGVDVIVASTAGGNYMLDLFLDDEKRWSEHPLHGDLVSVQPRHGAIKNATPIDFPHVVAANLGDTLDYLAVRETPCSVEGGSVRLVAIHGGKRADAWVTRSGDRVHYRYRGRDLLDTDRLSPYETLTPGEIAEHAALRRTCVEDARANDTNSWCKEAEWRRLSSFTPRPGSVVQIAHLYDLDRAGTINLFPVAGVAYNSRVPGRHAGEHFHEKDAFVGAWGAPVLRSERDGRIRTAVNGSMPMAVYEHLTGARLREREDGWGYPSLGNALFAPTDDD